MRSISILQAKQTSNLRLALMGGAAALALFLSLYGCAGEEPILIGFSGQLTGQYADLGVQGRNGAQLAVDEVNESGGISGKKLKLMVMDDQGTPEGALKADRALAKAGAKVIIGHMTSNLSVAVAPALEAMGVLMISPTTSTSKLAGLDDNFFRVQPVVTASARALAHVAAERAKVKKVGTIYDKDNRAYSEIFVDAFADELRSAGGEVTLRLGFNSSAKPDFVPLLRQLRDSGAQGVLIAASARDTAQIAQQVSLLEWPVPLFSSGWGQTEALIHNGGRAVEGILLVADYDSNNKAPALQRFRRMFHERYDREPIFAAAQSYESVMVLASALKATGGSNQGLKQALLATKNHPGLIGTISLDRYGDVQRTRFLMTVREGAFETLAHID